MDKINETKRNDITQPEPNRSYLQHLCSPFLYSFIISLAVHSHSHSYSHSYKRKREERAKDTPSAMRWNGKQRESSMYRSIRFDKRDKDIARISHSQKMKKKKKGEKREIYTPSIHFPSNRTLLATTPLDNKPQFTSLPHTLGVLVSLAPHWPSALQAPTSPFRLQRN